jgi:hypothetical protein
LKRAADALAASFAVDLVAPRHTARGG